MNKTSPNKIDTIEEATFPLAKGLAEQLGDVPEGAMITMKQFRLCLWRLADIRSGRVTTA